MLSWLKKVAPTLLIISLVLIPYSLVLGNEEEQVFYYLHDHLGGIEAVLDEEGNVVEHRDYLPYGNTRTSVNNSPTQSGLTTALQKEAYGFTGKEKDDETGLMYYGARYYDPLTGRFTSSDPWGGDFRNPQSFNKYSYVLNNPLIFVDPTGMYNMKSGEVEKGDTLSKITNELNDYFGTDYTYKDIAKFNDISNPDLINIGDKVYMGAYNDDGSAWLRSYDSKEVNIGYWNGLNNQQKIITHYGRNLFQNDLPKTKKELNSKEWDIEGEAVAHNLAGASGNIDYRGKGSRIGQQAIYDVKGNIVLTPENMGTFDFVSPNINLHGHGVVDVEPWLKWGNSPQDSTTKWERYKAFVKGIANTGYNRAKSVFK